MSKGDSVFSEIYSRQSEEMIRELRQAISITRKIIGNTTTAHVVVNLGRPRLGLDRYLARVLQDTKPIKRS